MKQTPPTLVQLRAQYPNQYLSYQTLLGTQEWKRKRDAVVERDGGRCTKCGAVPTVTVSLPHNGDKSHLTFVSYAPGEIVEVNGFKVSGEWLGEYTVVWEKAIVLHVHHLYYVKSRHPWEYENDALVTLCDGCHDATHAKETIPVYEIVIGKKIMFDAKVCNRCNCAGYFPQYSKVNDGRCFECEGARYTNVIL